jgi:hypothetical protein
MDLLLNFYEFDVSLGLAMQRLNWYRLLLPFSGCKSLISAGKGQFARFKGWKLMAGFVTRLWIVLRWLCQLGKRGELNPLLIRALVLTVKDIQFFLQFTLAQLLVRLSIHRRRAREESIRRMTDKRLQLIGLRQLVKGRKSQMGELNRCDGEVR